MEMRIECGVTIGGNPVQDALSKALGNKYQITRVPNPDGVEMRVRYTIRPVPLDDDTVENTILRIGKIVAPVAPNGTWIAVGRQF